MKYIWSDILFRQLGIRSGILFQKIGIRNGYVFEASMARPRPKSGQVHPPGVLRFFCNILAALRFLLTPYDPHNIMQGSSSLQRNLS